MKSNEFYHSSINIKEYEFDKIYLNKINDELIQIIKKFNSSTDINEKQNLGKFIPIDFPKCRFCGSIIINLNFLININIKEKYIKLIKPSIYCRELDGKKYYLSCCEKCLLEYFKDNPPKSQKYYFMKANRFGQYSFGYSYEEYKKICSMTTSITEKSLINKWGDELGKEKWKEYRKKRSYIASKQYYIDKYGKDEGLRKHKYDRSITKEGMINRYGEELGLKYFNDYVYKQKYTKSKEYMINKFGLEKTKEINKSKGQTIENYIKRLGKEEGIKQYEKVINNHKNYFSKLSQDFFTELDKYLSPRYKTYYATKNGEYGVMLTDNKYIKLDYFILELNLCIEFNGTYYHADPKIFNENDYPNPHNKVLTAKEIWENDNNRYKLLKESRNIDTIVIWENEYRDKNFNIINFIKNKLNIEL